MAANEPLPAHSWAEIHYYLRVTPCPDCGKGPWRAVPVSQADAADIDLTAACENCGHTRTFRFIAPENPPGDEDFEPINPTDQPSRIIDVGQWLSLFHLFIETASREADKPVARRLGYQAAQCLAEALKFYRDNELPDESAVWTEASRIALRDHPSKFARQRLRDMQAKLPPLPAMARRVQSDQDRRPSPSRRWWQFWKRR